ncbi:uncharacterized protein LOC144101772 isoform X1 [Amblyomma americanum]
MAHSEVETLPEVLEQPDVMPGSQENTPQKTEAAAVVQEREDIFVENADRHAEVVAQLLDTFHLAAHWDAGVGQQFIDVGCGPGNLTLHYLLPRLPPCRRLVAVDQSPVLLKAAKEKYSHPKIEYLQLDILDDVDGFVREQGQFQRLYSFATLHWVRDQRRAMRHIEKLMAPGGECMLLFKWTAYFMHLYDAMTKSPRWAKYSNVLEGLLPETLEIKDIPSLRAYARGLVESADLIPLACEAFSFPLQTQWSAKKITDSLLHNNQVSPLLKTEEEKEELAEFTRDIAAKLSIDQDDHTSPNRVLIFIHASKPLH